MRGSLPKRALELVLAWAQSHRQELMEDWTLCERKQSTRYLWIVATTMFLGSGEMATPSDSPWAYLSSGHADVAHSLGGGALLICCVAVLGLLIYREFDRWDRERTDEKATSTRE